MTGTIGVNGAYRVASSSCPPPSELSGSVGDEHVDLRIHVPGATGGPRQLSPGDIDVVLNDGTWSVGSSSNAPHGTSGTLQSSANGSGSVSVQNLYLQSNPSTQPQESGSITWSCQ